MFEFYFYLLRNGDPEHELKFDHWPTPEEVVRRLRRYASGGGSSGGIYETWIKCVMEHGLPKQPEVGKYNCETWGATTIHVRHI
jgi:hypothetical protein